MHANEVETKEKGKLPEIKNYLQKRLTFALERSGIHWVHLNFMQVKNFGLPAIFLGAQPWLLGNNTLTQCYLFTYTSLLL